MERESDLTGKLSKRQHIKNMRKILKVTADMDKTYFPCACIVHIINAVNPYIALVLSSYILDGITEGKSFKSMMAAAAVVIIIMTVLKFIASSIWNRLELRVNIMYYRYTAVVENKMLEMDFSRIDSPEVRILKERIEKDNNWGAGLNSVFWQFNGILFIIFNMVGAVILGIPAVIYMARSGNAAVFVLLAVFLIIMTVGNKYKVHFEKKVQNFMFSTNKTEEEIKSRSTMCWGLAVEDGEGYNKGKDIRIYNGYNLMKRWTADVFKHKEFRKEINDAALNEGAGAACHASMEGAVEGISYLIIAIMALAGTMTVGNIVKFAGCLKNLFSGILSLVGRVTDFALTARKQLSTLELIGISDDMYKGKLPVEKRRDNEYQIEFKDVSFRYPGTENYALRHFSLRLKIGERLAIVGMNGSGKTTMIKLLCRLYDPDEGEILLNGVNIKKFRQDEYSGLFSVVFQDYVLMPFKLGENVAVSSEYDREAVIKCLRDAGFGERLDKLDGGLDAYVDKAYDENGIELSGGEAQKVAIARAIYKDAPFILLDEPTAALDPMAEYEIYTNFEKIIGNKTAVYISHRLSSCKFCEKIAVFHQGRLVQYGSHDKLLEDKSGKYYEMWNSQARYYVEEG